MNLTRGVRTRFFRGVWKLSRPFLFGEARRKAWGLFGELLFLLVLVTAVNVELSFIGRDFFSALEQRRNVVFSELLVFYLGMFAVATVLGVLYRYTEERLALRWREWMTQRLLKRYFFARNYYRLRSQREIDNPDQRIAEDVKAFTATTLSLVLIVLNSLITIGAFVGVLYSISSTLVVVLLGYSVTGSLLTVLVGRRLVRLHYRQYRREADFRYGLIRVRDNAESIAFYRGEARERTDLGRRFRAVFRNFSQLIVWNRNLAVFTTGYNYAALIVPTLVVAPLYFRHEVEFGVVTQAGGAFAQVLAAMSVVITQFERLSAYAAGVGRLEGVWDALSAQVEAEEDDDPVITIEEGTRLTLQDVTISPPGQERVLIRDLSLQMKEGSGLLIMGASGRGKSSLLRAIASLWQSGAGVISRPQLREMMFLPQRPYMPAGSLRVQLLYPNRERADHTEALREALRMVNLEPLLERTGGSFDIALDWPNILSLGEQQRIAFARLFVRHPSLVCLDEATSALDEENEAAMYGLLRDSGMTYVSVGHRSTLKQFHDTILVLDENGGWHLESPEGPQEAQKVIKRRARGRK